VNKAARKTYFYKTTIQVTASLKDVYNRMVSRYGVTVSVCAGLSLLDLLGAKEREQLIDKINQMCHEDKTALK
jgi:hypothetical protein